MEPIARSSCDYEGVPSSSVPPYRKALGAVFISHASADKPFVRRLDSRLRREGFETWLDEKDMTIGDSISREVSAAIRRSRAVIVVVSTASLMSNWVRNELSQAAHRMVEGQCRLVPVLIDEVDVPVELTGLLYADCRPGRRGGISRVIDALDAEARRAESVLTTLESDDALTRSRGIDRLVQDVFGGRGWASGEIGATQSLDWEFVTIDAGGRDIDVVLDTVLSYGQPRGELTDHDWEYWTRQVREEFGESFGMLVSERTPSPSLRQRLHPVAEGVLIETSSARIFAASGALVLVVLDQDTGDEEGRSRLETARQALIETATQQEPPVVPFEH